MAKKIVLAIIARGGNDAIRGTVMAYTDSLAALGLDVVHITTDDAELAYGVKLLASGDVAFGITWLGIAQYLPVSTGPGGDRANAWEAYGVPLLKIHGDIPAYYQDLHQDIPFNSVNLYGASEFIAYRKRWMRNAGALTALIPPIPLSPLQRCDVDVAARRRGKLVYLKNGNSPAELRSLWHSNLPHSFARLIGGMADEAVARGCRPGMFLIGDFVSEFLGNEGIEPDTLRGLAPFLTAQLDDYLRRIKSEMIAKALLDLPVVVQGDRWEHIDFRGRRASHRPGQDFGASQAIFRNELGIIDMSPNIDSGGHERVQRAAGSYALAITNRQGWIERDLPGFAETMFEFNPESIAARVAEVVARPDHYVDLAMSFGEQFRVAYPPDGFANRAIDMAELAALHYGLAKPMIQPFFVWPRKT